MTLASEVRWTILATFLALVIVSVLTLIAVKLKPHRDFSSPRRWIRTWWVILGVFSGTLLWSPGAVVFFWALVSYLTLKEFLSMTPTRRADRRVLFYAYLSIPFQYYFAAIGWYGMFMVFIPVLMFIWLPTRMWMMGQTNGFLRAAGTLHWALMITVFSLSHAAFLLQIHPESASLDQQVSLSSTGRFDPGPGLVLFLVLMTQLNDLFQYCWGKCLGKRKLAPRISPDKTYAGLIGGVISTIALSAWLGPMLTLLDSAQSAIAGLIIGIGGFAGVLCVNALKRDLKIRDFGGTLPGHGGVLDRVDSLIFTAPLFFHFVLYCFRS